MENNETFKTVNDLFKLGKPIKVPAYQRAYAWEEKQINQFINDLVEFKERNGYYFGHFILENNNESQLEIIDGQQRLTTFVLFLMVCKAFNKDLQIENYISNFKTVDYDSNNLEKIQQQLSLEKEWTLENFELTYTNQTTLSLKKIIEALDIFGKAFVKGTLNADSIEKYISVVTNAHASVHITKGKEVAVQIFELHNTRGIQLNTIEKVKAKMMKAVYKHNTKASANEDVKVIQDAFAEIFRLEELVASQSFRGDLQLDELLLSHLRVIDDGSKLLSPEGSNTFHSPSRDGNREELILKYIDEKTEVSEKRNTIECIEYAKKLSNELLLSTKIICEELPELDKENKLLGDSLILEKDFSTEFYLILLRINREYGKNELLIKLWEKLLFIRNFHEKYYGLSYRDNFQDLFFKLIKNNERDYLTIISLLNEYIKIGFRPDKLGGNLDEVVKNYLELNKSSILDNGYNWWREKTIYTLYKFEKSTDCNIEQLRSLMKSSRSIEHMLPQEWQWQWFVKDEKNITESDRKKGEKINSYINGLGNLLIISSKENTSVNNLPPNEKIYKSCTGGSYTEHNGNRGKWDDHKNWEKIITERGNRIYEFVIKYFF